MDLNPFASQTRAPGVPMMRGPVVDTTQHNNPFGGPSPGSPPPSVAPVKTLATLVEEWITLPGPCLGVMVGVEGGVSLPLPMRLLTQTQWTPGPPLPPLPPSPPLPTLEEAVSWARLQQWQRLLASVPPAGQLLPPSTQPLTPATLGLLRCRWAALGGTRRWLACVEEGVSVLASLVARGGDSAGAGASDASSITPTIAVWLCLLAEALRSCAMWRESVFVSHGVIRALGLPTPAPPSPMGGAGATGWAVKLEGGLASTAAPSGGVEVGGAAAAAAAVAAPPASTTTSTTIPGAALVVDSALALLFKGASQVPHRVASRVILIAGGVCCSALSGSGFGLGAANAASDTASATASRMNPPPNTPPTPGDPPSTPTATAAATATPHPPSSSLVGGDGAINWALEPPPEWLTAGLALLGVARSHRSIGRDTEASVALTSLFAITQWRAAGDLLMGAVGGSVGSKDLSQLSPHTAYVAGVLGCYRGDEALAQGRFAEALPLFEASLVALSSRFLPPPSSSSSSSSSSAAAAASPPITTLLAASSSIVSTVGGLSLLPARPSNLAAIPLPAGFLPDPCDLLVDAVVGVAEAVRKLPPPSTGTTIFPNHLSILILEATLKCAPAVVLRAGVCAYLNALYDAGKQPMDAAAAKRLLAAISQAYGVLV